MAPLRSVHDSQTRKGTVVSDPGHRRLALRTILAGFPGPAVPDWAGQLLADGLAGYALFGHNITGPDQLTGLTGQLRATRADALIAVDEEGGDVTRLAHHTGSRYPGNAALGVVDDPASTSAIYQAIGAELADHGINLNLAPTVDVNSADDNPIIGTRSFGTDPTRVARHSAAAVTALQRAGIAACAKHFPGHGATSTDSHLTRPVVDDPLALLRRRDLPPFAAAIEAGVRAVMTAHIRIPELTGTDPATFSRAALVELLRREYGFSGVILTDALEMAGASGDTAPAAGRVAAAAVRALAAGADLLCLGSRADDELVRQVADTIANSVANGQLPVSRLEQAATRIAALASWATTGTAGDTVSRQTSQPGADDIADLGYRIARRAIAIEGPLEPLTDPLVVQLESAATIAAAAVPWGLAPLLPEAIQITAAEPALDKLRPHAAGRSVVVVGRQLHRRPTSRALVELLTADYPATVVEMGWPSTWRPAGARTFISTYGASRANSTALADVLSLPRAPR